MRAVIFTAGALVGFALGTAIIISRAEPLGVPDDTIVAAVEVGDDPVDVQGALNTLRDAGQPDVDARTYLCWVGELACPKPAAAAIVVAAAPGIEARLACAMHWESHGDPNATNARSKAAGLYQFLWSTWYALPQAVTRGRSPYDPVAAHEAAVWLASQDHGRGFAVHWAADVAKGC